MTKLLRFRPDQYVYRTVDEDIYRVDGHLVIRYGYYYISAMNYSYGSQYHRTEHSSSGTFRFELHGYWSDSSKKLCMIGSAAQSTRGGDVVLKIKFASENPTMFSSAVTGTLESIDPADSSGYFEPISFTIFREVSGYKYTLLSQEVSEQGLNGDLDVPKNESLVLEPDFFCSTLSRGFTTFELEYGEGCETPKNCSPVDAVAGDRFLPHLVNLYPIQCSRGERKIRYSLTFQNATYSSFDQNFDRSISFIAEGSWDETYNRILVVGCQVVNPSDYSSWNVIGDCGLRLSLRYPSIWTIRRTDQVVGQIWANKSVNASGYFKNINLKSVGAINLVGGFPRVRYMYTELDRVKALCVANKQAKKHAIYPDGHSHNMRFDISVRNSKGLKFAWGYAQPFSVGTELFDGSNILVAMSPTSDAEFTMAKKSPSATVNISYTLSISPFRKVKFANWFRKLAGSVNHHGQMVIHAEGVYNVDKGHLCMVGCRKLTNGTFDCEILVNIYFAPLTERSDFIKGTIQSTREMGDSLHFDQMSVSSNAFYTEVAKRSIWRMDLEITLVLVSNTMMCILAGLQIFHVKRNPEVLSGISLLMLLILTLGLVIPLVLNFEAFFSDGHGKQRLWLSTGGWVEAHEVAVRVVTMVAFLFQIRLFQLVWNEKMRDESENRSWNSEKKAILVSLPMYIFGGLITFLLNWMRNKYGYRSYFLWGDMRSYFGLILDCFLLPQIILNAFMGSVEKSLAHMFYAGTSVVRVVPHVYDQYRAQNYPTSHVNGTYYYANHASGLYSTAWDVIIPCVVVALALVVFFQQRHGGRCVLPKRFRELELYHRVNNNEQ